MITNNSFPFLDMELSWVGNELDFKAYSKPGQKIKYLDRASTHRDATRKAVPAGVFKRIARLTNAVRTIQSLYPDHYAALEKAGLTPKIVPTLRQVWRLDEQQQKRKEEENDPDKVRK